MGRTKPHNIQVRISDEGFDRVQRMATEYGVTVAALVRLALAAGISAAEARLREEAKVRREGWDPTAPPPSSSPPRRAPGKIEPVVHEEDPLPEEDPWTQ